MNIDNEFKEKANEAFGKGVGFAFCPKHLPLEEYADLWVFPYNILFMKYRREENDSYTAGYALYEPSFDSLNKSPEEWTMKYHNKYGGNGYVEISFKPEDNSYQGNKFVDGTWVGSATGRIDLKNPDEGWKLFFFHLTMLGLSNGERCMFRRVTADPNIKQTTPGCTNAGRE